MKDGIMTDKPYPDPPRSTIDDLDQGSECGPKLSMGCGSLGLLAQRQQAGDGQMGSAP